MTPADIEVIERYYPEWELFKKCGELIKIPPHAADELLRVYREKVDKYYHYNKRCAECFKDFFKLVYTWYDSHTEGQQAI